MQTMKLDVSKKDKNSKTGNNTDKLVAKNQLSKQQLDKIAKNRDTARSLRATKMSNTTSSTTQDTLEALEVKRKSNESNKEANKEVLASAMHTLDQRKMERLLSTEDYELDSDYEEEAVLEAAVRDEESKVKAIKELNEILDENQLLHEVQNWTTDSEIKSACDNCSYPYKKFQLDYFEQFKDEEEEQSFNESFTDSFTEGTPLFRVL